jgi:hypothetical protein
MKTSRSLLAVAIASALSGVVLAQVDPLTTTAGFKAACEKPGNTVRITTDFTVNAGYRAGYPEQVATGCTIELVGDSEIKFDNVGLKFADPLVILGGDKTGVALQRASLAGTSVVIDLIGVEHSIKTEFSRIDATAGNLEINVGDIAKMELMGSITGGVPLTRAALAATGNLSVSGGQKLTIGLKEVGLASGQLLSITARGAESEVLLDDSPALSFTGGIAFAVQGVKSKFNMSNGGITARGGDISITAAQGESGIALSNVMTNSSANTVVSGSGFKSDVGISNARSTAGGSLVVSAGSAADPAA